jgi:hypothetical protein
MKHARWAIFPLVLAAILFGSTARAQDPALRRFNVAPYVGAFFFDDDELSQSLGVEVDIGALFGARAGYEIAPAWQIEGAYGYSSLSTEVTEFQGDPGDVELGEITAHLIYGAIDYLLFYRDNPTALLLSAGVGTIILDGEGEASDPEAEFLLDLGIGFTHPVRDWITFRGEARDHMQFCGAAEGVGDTSACPADDDVLHHIEVSAGAQFWIF